MPDQNMGGGVGLGRQHGSVVEIIGGGHDTEAVAG